MEAQLAAYRARKAKEHNSATSFTEFFKKKMTTVSLLGEKKVEPEVTQQNDVGTKPALSHNHGNTDNKHVGYHGNVPDNARYSRRVQSQDVASAEIEEQAEPNVRIAGLYIPLWWLTTGLKVALWLILWFLFIQWQFGAIFFICSMFYIIYTNTRTGPKRDSAPSAYSVFNADCERIEGTFTAEQFEKELGLNTNRP